MDLITVQGVRVAAGRDDLTFAPGERPLGGGTWLYSEQQDATGLVDLTRMGWDPVSRGDILTIAGTCTIETLRDLPEPIFRQCADSLLASWKIQRVATVGGNIALSLPAGPMTSLAVALGGTLVLWTATGERRVPAVDFVTGVQANLLEPGEVIRALEIPLPLGRTAFRRIALSPLGRTGTLVLGRLDDAGRIHLTVTGGTTRPHVVTLDTIDTIDDWYDDPHGSPDWRRAMTMAFATEIVEELS